jgi:hypothetical protein
MPFTADSRIVVSDEQVHTTLGGEAVILGLRDGVYYGLDSVGARVWALIAEPRRVDDLVSAIVSEFDVGREQCESDVMILLNDLAKRGLVRELPAVG